MAVRTGNPGGARRPGNPGGARRPGGTRPFIRSNYTGGGLAPGSALGSQPPAATPPQVTDAPGFGPKRNRPRNRLAPGAGLPGPRNVVTQPPAKPSYSATTVANPPPAAPAFDPNTFDPNTDPTYRQNVAAEHRTTMGKIAGYQRQVTDAQTALPTFDYTTGIENPLTGAFTGPGAKLARQYGLDVLAQQIAAARRGGGGASTSLAQRLGAITQTYADKKTGALDAYQKLAQQIGTPDAQGNYAPGTTIAGLLGDESVYNTGERGNAVSRATAAAQQNPTIGGVAPPVTSPVVTAPGRPHTPPRPARVPAGARYGSRKPGPNWRGVGGGWWVPTGGKK